MMISFGAVFTVLLALFVGKFIVSLGVHGVKNLIDFDSLGELASKLLGYKEMLDIATDNNKSDYSDFLGGIASSVLGKNDKPAE